MAQDIKKETQEIERSSLKDKIKQASKYKKASLKEVGEMGKPSLKAKFESAMQKEWKSRPENMKEDFRSELKELPSKEVMVPVKKKPLKSMSKGSMKMERY
jgi:hypothetical protein